MSKEPTDGDFADYLKSSESWAMDRARSDRQVMRIAWVVAGVLGTVALAEAIALIVMMPLKTVVPYTLLVDRQTGYIQAIKPLDQEVITPDQALTRSFIAQYVIARDGFDISSLKDDYRKVALWSTGEARDGYVAGMQAGNPSSRLTNLPRSTIIAVEIRGISSLSANTVLVRYVTTRTDRDGQTQAARPWQAVLSYRFSGAPMSAADRLVNPLGFQVLRYRRDAETAPDPAQPGMPAAPLNNAAHPVGQPPADVVRPDQSERKQ